MLLASYHVNEVDFDWKLEVISGGGGIHRENEV